MRVWVLNLIKEWGERGRKGRKSERVCMKKEWNLSRGDGEKMRTEKQEGGFDVSVSHELIPRRENRVVREEGDQNPEEGKKGIIRKDLMMMVVMMTRSLTLFLYCCRKET